MPTVYNHKYLGYKMLRIKDFKILKEILDFTSSGSKKVEVTQLVCNDILFLNAYEYMDWKGVLNSFVKGDQIQFLICKSCGTPHCESSNWLTIRKTGDFIIFCPAFSQMIDSDGTMTEYSPPEYVRQNGIPYMSSDIYNEIRKVLSNFPHPDDIPYLSDNDAINIFSHDSPCRVLGDFYKSKKADYDSIIASSSNDLERDKRFLVVMANKLFGSSQKALIQPIKDSNEIITLYIDKKKIFEWKALIENDDMGLLLSEDFFLSP